MMRPGIPLLWLLGVLTSACMGVGVDPADVTPRGNFDLVPGDSGEDAGDLDPQDRISASDGFQGLIDLELEFGPGADTGPSPGFDTDTPPLCIPDEDGALTAAELPAMIGAIAAFTQSAPGQVVLAPVPGGTWDPACPCHRWNFEDVGSADDQIWDGVLPGAGHWFDAHIPEGDFVQTFGGGLLGVYLLEEDGLYMAGLASEAEGWTALRYDPPVLLLALPMSLGDVWITPAAQAVGLFEGDPYPLDTGFTGVLSVEHTYAGKADKRGKVRVPAGEFDVWRVVVDVNMEVQNSIALLPVATARRKVALFMAECTGLVARLRSEVGEVADDFSAATEYRRLGWGSGGTP